MLKEKRGYPVVREEKYEYYMAAPPKDNDPLRMMLEHQGKRAEQKALVRDQQYEYYVAPQPQDDPLRIMLEHLGKRAEQKALVENQVPPLKKHGGVVDCNELAKICGGVVFTDYDRSEFLGLAYRDYNRIRKPPFFRK